MSNKYICLLYSSSISEMLERLDYLRYLLLLLIVEGLLLLLLYVLLLFM